MNAIMRTNCYRWHFWCILTLNILGRHVQWTVGVGDVDERQLRDKDDQEADDKDCPNELQIQSNPRSLKIR